jgi:raffinose/stachyose/melibiose transport system substrate-binding protein
MADLNEAVHNLKAAGIKPIALDVSGAWPAAHYWHNFALRARPSAVLTKATQEFSFDDPCFVRAGQDLAAFLATDPFMGSPWKTTRVESDGSAVRLLATDRAAMELMGEWELTLLRGLGPVDSRFGWFPFPSTGGAGEPAAQLGGGQGFSCAAWADSACVALLKYLVSPAEDVIRAVKAAAGRGR